MILVFEKADGMRISVTVDCIVDIEECEDCTIINTIVSEIEVINSYDEVIKMVAKYQDMESVNFSRN